METVDLSSLGIKTRAEEELSAPAEEFDFNISAHGRVNTSGVFGVEKPSWEKQDADVMGVHCKPHVNLVDMNLEREGMVVKSGKLDKRGRKFGKLRKKKSWEFHGVRLLAPILSPHAGISAALLKIKSWVTLLVFLILFAGTSVARPAAFPTAFPADGWPDKANSLESGGCKDVGMEEFCRFPDGRSLCRCKADFQPNPLTKTRFTTEEEVFCECREEICPIESNTFLPTACDKILATTQSTAPNPLLATTPQSTAPNPLLATTPQSTTPNPLLPKDTPPLAKETLYPNYYWVIIIPLIIIFVCCVWIQKLRDRRG